jgi:uncharacterized protein
MGRSLLKPSLYTQSDAGPQLLGGVCRCGHVFYPMQTFGCEKCGAFGDALTPKALRARGTLITASVVQLHHDTRRPTPFAIGAILLDDGPVVRTLLSDVSLAVQLQARVRGEFVHVTQADGAPMLDLRFTKESA